MTLAAVAVAAGTAPAWAIRGGVESQQPYSFAGSLQRPGGPREDGHVCGVTLIAPQWALTAAHCARNPTDAAVGTPRGWTVRFGSLSVSTGGELVDVDEYYRRSTGRADQDIALLRLARPVGATPAALPETRVADHTPVRIIGWGWTCDDEPAPGCYPDRLREADTQVNPAADCDTNGIQPEYEICVGALDGSVEAANTDSGGPALLRTGDGWTVVGTVIGANNTFAPVTYSDVSYYRDWIAGIVDGSAVPPDDVLPDLQGGVFLNRCSASVVRTPSSRPDDPALLLTNGHCVGERPAPGDAVVDRPDDQPVEVLDRTGYPGATARTTRLVYATMTGTDVALYRLDKTYAQLDVKIFTLSGTPATAGTGVDIVSAGAGERYRCVVDAVIPHLREEGYQQDDSYRYATGCGITHGSSGAPLVLADGITVVGVHSTGNDSGEQCTANNPCEVAADGTVRVEAGRRYAQRTTMLPACLTTGSRLDLDAPGCGLARPRTP